MIDAIAQRRARGYAGPMRLAGLLAFVMLSAACATQASRPDDRPAHDPAAVDDSCVKDADCAVKDVGNCCGYYPACVNRSSPTFAEQVKADCAKKGIAGVCGFPVIEACRCIEGRCNDVTSTGAKEP